MTLEFLLTYLLGIVTAIIAFFIKRKFFSKAPKESFEPTIHISSLIERSTLYAEIHNVGNDPARNLSIEITWLESGKNQNRTIGQFFNPDQDPMMNNPHNCTFLNANEKKKIAGLPHYSDDGIINFKVKGEGVNSGRKIEESFSVKNEKK